MTSRQLKLKLVEVPTASLKIDGERLGTDRVRTPVPTQPVLLPSLEAGLTNLGYDVNTEIINMKLGNAIEQRKGVINLEGLTLENYILGIPFESIDDQIRQTHVLGLTSNFSYSSGIVADFIRHAKKINPGVIIVVGGADASVRQEYYLSGGADAIIIGEGENNGHFVIDALLQGKSLQNIARVAFRNNNGIVKTIEGIGNDPVKLDELPFPALDRISLADYLDTGEGPLITGAFPPLWAYETSRGCKQVCHFCTTPFLKPGYRTMSLNKIAQYFAYMKKAGVRTIISNEDNILSRMHTKDYARDPLGREEVLQYARLIRETSLPFEFANGLEIGKLADENGIPDQELIDALFYHKINSDGSFSGTYRCYIPLENLTDKGIRSLRKLRLYDTEKAILEAIAKTKVPMLNFGVIVGLPAETPESIAQTMGKCYEIKKAITNISPNTDLYFNFFMFAPLPGTPDFRLNQNRMVASVDAQPELWSFYVSGINGNHYSAREMTLLRREMSREINGTNAMWVYDGQDTKK